MQAASLHRNVQHTFVALQESLANQPTPEMLAEVHSIVQEALNELPDADGHGQQQQQPRGQGKVSGVCGRLHACPLRAAALCLSLPATSKLHAGPLSAGLLDTHPSGFNAQLPTTLTSLPLPGAGDMLASEELSSYLTSGTLSPRKDEDMVAARGL